MASPPSSPSVPSACLTLTISCGGGGGVRATAAGFFLGFFVLMSMRSSARGDGNKNSTQARRQTPSPFLADVLYAFPAARNGGHYSGSSPFAAPARPRFQPYHGRRLPPATQRRPPPPAFGARGRRLGRRFAMYTGGLVDAEDAFADFDDY